MSKELMPEALQALVQAAHLNWRAIEPSIFGTLFERSLDPNKRAQLGAHYTSRQDIELIVEPVLMQPLRYEWDTVQLEAETVREQYNNAESGRARNTAAAELLELRERILNRIRETTVLDPACGSGNFLYVSLQLLMDLERDVIEDELWSGLQRATPEVHPRQMYGIEKEPIAHALASIVVWIGYIQWRTNNAYIDTIRDPILEELKENIVRKDAILAFDEDGNPTQPEWPPVDVIVGNPPFLGTKRLKGELGDEYVERLHSYYDSRIPGFSDLVCYWFENARTQIETGQAKRAGLLATNSIRGGENRKVLQRIKDTGNIFMAWSDREWILDGAAVRVSMVGFDNGIEMKIALNGLPVTNINPDLTASAFDISVAGILPENARISFLGDVKGGSFDITNDEAQRMLRDASNPDGRHNSEVIRRTANATDITRRWRDYWIIDFGVDMKLHEAKKYIAPLQYVQEVVMPEREKGKPTRSEWWLHMRPGPSMRRAIRGLPRYIATPSVAKHRLFVWFSPDILSTHANVLFARDDDYFFGVLHSKLHETWSLRMGTWLGKGNDPRYTPTTTFETFPFPWSPGHEDESHPAHAAISAAAKQLHEERHAWLNPEGASAKELKDRTLTNLYNALRVWRGLDDIRVKPAAGSFAPRLDELHRALDEAVCDAYGWEYDVLDDEEEILRRLLALNLERAERG